MVEECIKMPVVDLNLSRLQKLLGAQVSKKTIIETLPFLGLDIESESKTDVRIEYSPNRADYCSVYGIALGLEGLLGLKKGGISLRIRPSDYQLTVDSSVGSIRPYVTCICARGPRLDQVMIKELMGMQEDLHFGIGRRRKKSSIGIHDLDKISFPLRYTTQPRTLEFIPLGGADSMSVEQIIAETDVGRDYGVLLGDLKSVPVILDADGKTVSLPPVINASVTALTTRTQNLFVEVTGMSPDDVEDALSVIATILQKAGFVLYAVKVSGAKNHTARFLDKKITLDPKLVCDTLGLDLSTTSIISSLKKSRLNASLQNKKIECIIPRYRFDIFGVMDIVEEAALGYGIQNLAPKLSPSQTLGQINNQVLQIRLVDQLLIGLGYTEALNSCLTSQHVLYDATRRKPSDVLLVLDSKSQQHTVLRDALLPGLVNNIARNTHQPYPQRLYETGTVFYPKNPIGEQINLGALAAHGDANFSESKSILKSVLKTGFNIESSTRASSDLLFEAGRAADIIVDDAVVGVMGQISSETLRHYKIHVPVVGFELTLTGLIFD